jgi:hypothetical protein
MDEKQSVDELYRAFCQSLPGHLHAEAQGLAHTLGLAPARGAPWSAVFSHEVTLAAPALIADAMPSVHASTVREAGLAHMLAVIEAFGTDRLHDGQVRHTPQLETLLAHARRARDLAIQRVAPRVTDPAIDFAKADEETLTAIQAERQLLQGGEPAGFERYLAIAAAKQRVGLPASIALAHAAGWGPRERAALGRALGAIGVGLQIYDDVMDWEDDHVRGGAWAVVLAAGSPGGAAQGAAPPDQERGPRDSAPSDPPSAVRHAAPSDPPEATRHAAPAPVRRFVLESGVLARMLAAARRRYREARWRSAALGARRLAAWAEGQEGHTAELSRCEAESPGYANRARALSAWARAVLA